MPTWTRDTRKNIPQLYIRRNFPILATVTSTGTNQKKSTGWENPFFLFSRFFRRILQILVFSTFLIYLSPPCFCFVLSFFLLWLLWDLHSATSLTAFAPDTMIPIPGFPYSNWKSPCP
jgi:hypothetical protein